MLDVPGARLYYEVRGSGPVLLVILGGSTDPAMAAPLAEILSARYTVITYDRRGYSRSPLSQPFGDRPVEQHADDALRLLEAAGSAPAHVFATHAGALIAFDLMARHPDRVRRLVAHEPPVYELLPDAERWRRMTAEALDLFEREGAGAAMRRMGEETGLMAPGPPAPGLPEWVRDMLTRMAANAEPNLRYELRGFSGFLPDAEALRGASVVVGHGAEDRGTIFHRTTLAVAELLGRQAVELPGDHVGYLRDPGAFAGALHACLT
ncbi:alpha/beta fold hydrolase [Nonomuraea gerenzanensis]|uniref:Putative hydrolase n=1 Tax=Nonomuraea gerenzanensis TaxID=93944 RepID=A0A1M4EHM1_9ACTN|nr:alpha/beta hydrolase [Nonomuraea gerenzanensis]UBU09858.1 alpha/beta hydrolase [Nonomuraea gerenzanensis]SBO98310.1 putative hydrolase [Nonomuraea gerenzanensis]